MSKYSEITMDDEEFEEWQSAYESSRLRDVPFETMSGVPVEPVYGDAPYPGYYPFTRGLHAAGYRSRLWTMRMFAGFGTAEDTNARFKELLRAGGTGLSTAFDMPTLMGRDSDSPWALGEVGRAGVAVDTLADMEDLFAGIDLSQVSTSMTINGPAATLLAMYVAVAENNSVCLSSVKTLNIFFMSRIKPISSMRSASSSTSISTAERSTVFCCM